MRTKDTELVTAKNSNGQVRTAVEIAETGYRLVRNVWITPESKIKDIMSVIESLPAGEPERAERNSVFDILSSRFKVTKKG